MSGGVAGGRSAAKRPQLEGVRGGYGDGNEDQAMPGAGRSDEDRNDAMRLVVGGLPFKCAASVLREGAEFFDRLLEGRDMEPTARVIQEVDGPTLVVDRDGAVFSHLLRYWDSKNAGELPKEESLRQQLLVEARYYEARQLVNVLSGQVRRHATVGPENMAMVDEENRYRHLFAQNRDHSDLASPFLTLVSLYGDDGKLNAQFDHKHFHLSLDADRFAIILRGTSTVPAQGPSAVAKFAEFRSTFNKITDGLFVGFDWSNVFVAGGAVLRCLIQAEEFDFKHSTRGYYRHHFGRPIGGFSGGSSQHPNCEFPTTFKGSDVDLFLYDLSEEQAMAKVSAIQQHLESKAAARGGRPKQQKATLGKQTTLHYVRSKGSLTMALGGVSIQIILRLYKSRPEVVMAFDLDCCAIGFDGDKVYIKCVLLLQNVSPYCRMCSLTIKCHFALDGDKVWTLPRARRALNGRYNLIDETRPNVKYEARLFKYSLRGFAVGVPGMRTCQKRPIYVAKEAC